MVGKIDVREKNIILTGFMGTGKSAVGRILARRLKRRLLDTDTLVEELTGMSIPVIFDRFGETYFRDRESEVVAGLERQPPGTLVVATGGGVVLREANMASLEKHGVIVLLTASVDAILQRTARSDDRPLLRVPDARERVASLLQQREPFYRRHHLAVDTTGKSPAAVSGEIISHLGMKN